MRNILLVILLQNILILTSAGLAQVADSPATRTTTPIPTRSEFRVRYINGTSVYIDGGRNSGLNEGTKLVIKQNPAEQTSSAQKNDTVKDTNAEGAKPVAEATVEPGVVAELTVVSVASNSAVCDVVTSTRDVKVDDIVSMPQGEIQKRQEKQMLGNSRVYPIVVSFTEGDPLDEEVRDAIPHPPLPEVNQARGRIGFSTSLIRGLGPNTPTTATDVGLVVRADINRIHGTHWNLNGYWRGSLQMGSTPTQPTIQDLINRTYQMSATYVNPESSWTTGIGRLYVPWASSLETIDGGYVAKHVAEHATLGIFGGSTPDPTSWNYAPNQEIGGTFVNLQVGSFDTTRISSTTGFGVDLLSGTVNRPFVFTENDLSYKRYLSIYQSMQIDKPTANPSTPDVTAGIGRSLLSLRAQLHPRISIDLTDTYFRDVPTYDPILVGTGLLDKYLYQGINGGARVSLPMHITGYFSIGSSNNSSDPKASLNKLFGVTMANIWKTGLTADVRYSKFDSTFASGSYDTLTISRDLTDRFHLNVQAGRQAYISNLTPNAGSYFANFALDTDLGSRYFLQTNYTTQRGGSQDYEQWMMTFGYRFDNRSAERRAAHAKQP